jgi:Holliday junction resolvase RusA-like endonuclease
VSTVISFFAPGEPVPQPRPRAFARKIGQTWQARIYNPSTAEAWKNCIAAAAQAHIPREPLLGPVLVDLDFYFPRPLNHYGTGKNEGRLKENAPKWHTSLGDRDNMDKAVLDCLSVLGFFRNDSQACSGTINKLYATPPGLPMGCKVVIVSLENDNKAVTNEAARTVFAPKQQNGESQLNLLT